MAWMSPEELQATEGGLDKFVSRLSGDIHTAGSIMIFILTGGLHAYGPPIQTPATVINDWFDQQTNMVKGRRGAKLRPLTQNGE